MNEPATKDDLDALEKRVLARIDLQDQSIEGMRTQNSHEHGSLFTKLLHLTEVMHWLRAKWQSFSRNDNPPVPPKHD